MQWLHADRAITGDGKTILTPGWVCIDGSKILEVTDKKPESANSGNTIEMPGITLTPGLINIHDHICRKEFRINDPSRNFAELAAKLMASPKEYIILHSVHNMYKYLTEEGITFTRDYGLAGLTSIYLARAIEEGLVPGPEINAGGEPICITGGHCYRQGVQADGPAEVMKRVREQIVYGAKIIKFMGSGGLERFPEEDPTMPQFTIEELTAGVNCAHDLGYDTAIHAYSNEGIRRALIAGIDNIEHCTMMSEDLVEIMVKQNTNVNPTGSGIRGAVKRGSQVKYIDLVQERIYSKQEQGLRWIKAAGLNIGAGTDSPGFMFEEIEWLAETLNETPVEALAHATGINAKILKRSDIGMLEAGRRADIVAWRGDLSKSFAPLQKVYMTWAAGKTYKGIAYDQE